MLAERDFFEMDLVRYHAKWLCRNIFELVKIKVFLNSVFEKCTAWNISVEEPKLQQQKK